MQKMTKETEHIKHSASAHEAHAPVPLITESTEASEAKVQRLTQILAQWTEFGFWLADAELIVYRNAIERERDWRWAWGENAGMGYGNATAAVIGALQHHVLSSQRPETLEGEDGIPLDLSQLADPPESFVSLWNQLLAPTKQQPCISWWKRLFPQKRHPQHKEKG